jgi:isopenicillin-N N-acyltransferase-like protein
MPHRRTAAPEALRMKAPAPLPLIEIAGPPRERGRAYGEQAREQVHASLAYYREAMTGPIGLAWDEVTGRAAQWRPVVQRFAPDLLEEVTGIAEGAGCAEAEVLALNARSELLYSASAGADREECTSFALLAEASGDGHTYCGQNWDWRAGAQDSVVMLRVIAPGKPTLIMQIEAGQVGRHGASSAGLGLNANGLKSHCSAALGVPQPFIRRRVLEAPSFPAALKVIFSARQQISANLLLTHRDGFAIDLETTPGRHGWLYPDRGVLVHGNHYQAFLPGTLADSYRPSSADSLYRAPRLTAALRAARDETTERGVRKVIAAGLRDHFGYPESVCCHPDTAEPEVDRWQTVSSSVVDLTTGDYLVAAGPPCRTEYTPLPWNLYQAPGSTPT